MGETVSEQSESTRPGLKIRFLTETLTLIYIGLKKN